MHILTESFITEAQANIVRIQGEIVADTTTYWAINERLQCVYDGDTTAQYDDMMLQLKALHGISLGNSCILGIEADIEHHIEAEQDALCEHMASTDYENSVY